MDRPQSVRTVTMCCQVSHEAQESHVATSSIDHIIQSEDKPLGDPRQILAVFRQSRNIYVRVNMARDYERRQGWKVHEYLPLNFELGEFRRRFCESKHGELMGELDEKVTELKEGQGEGKTAVTIWLERFSGWLQPMFGCLSLETGNHPADDLQEDRTKRRDSINNDINDSETHSSVLHQPMTMQRTSTTKCTHQVVLAEGAKVVSIYQISGPSLGSLLI